MTSEIWITKRSIDYSTQKLKKQKISKKYPWTIAYENWQNGGFTRSGDHLTLKMDRFAHPWTIAHDNRQNEGFTRSWDHMTLKMGRFTCLNNWLHS
ncbi:hypothetical protein H5410_056431 [Solanum commersonii]|uniref:Uncharacterized protein n=1 Tax=Solanum commersonii TaxID=4109 RepID=A0A9J5WK80_SOLCO|nr:hypothetical protein H5410_056431 [Solanum commersonii]